MRSMRHRRQCFARCSRTSKTVIALKCSLGKCSAGSVSGDIGNANEQAPEAKGSEDAPDDRVPQASRFRNDLRRSFAAKCMVVP